MLKEYIIELNNKDILIEENNRIIYQWLFKRKWWMFGDFFLFNQNKEPIAKFDFTRPKNFSYDVNIFITETKTNKLITLTYKWKTPHFKFEGKAGEFEFILHKNFLISIFYNNNQIGYVKVPKSEFLYQKKYKLYINYSDKLNFILLLIIGVIYKFEVIDHNDGHDPIQLSIGFISPLQEEIKPFDSQFIDNNSN